MADETFRFSTNIDSVVRDIRAALAELNQATSKVGQTPNTSEAEKYIQGLIDKTRQFEQAINQVNSKTIGRVERTPRGGSTDNGGKNDNYARLANKAQRDYYLQVEKSLENLAKNAQPEANIIREALRAFYGNVAEQLTGVNARGVQQNMERVALERDNIQLKSATTQGILGNTALLTSTARSQGNSGIMNAASGTVQLSYNQFLANLAAPTAQAVQAAVTAAVPTAINANVQAYRPPTPTAGAGGGGGAGGTGGTGGTGGSGAPAPIPPGRNEYQELLAALQRTAGPASGRNAAITGPEARRIGTSQIYTQQMLDPKSGQYRQQFLEANTKDQTATVIQDEFRLRQLRELSANDQMKDLRQINQLVEQILANARNRMIAVNKDAVRAPNVLDEFFRRDTLAPIPKTSPDYQQALTDSETRRLRNTGAYEREIQAGINLLGQPVRAVSSSVGFTQTGPGRTDGTFFDRTTGDLLSDDDKRLAAAKATLLRETEREARAEAELAARSELLANVRAGTARRLGNTNTFADDSTGQRRYAELTPNGAKYVTQQNDPLRYDRLQANDIRQQPRSVGQGFLAGLTSAGFGGNAGGGINFAGLAQAAGTTVKYSALYAVLNDVQQAAGQAVTELLNYQDSIANITLALGNNEEPSQAFINNLANIASVSGANVGDAMDVAAQGMQAFGDETTQTNEQIQKIGESFAAAVDKLSIVTGTDLKTASSQMRAILSGVTEPGQQTTDTQMTQVLDAVAGAKAKFGGDSDDIAQGFQAIATSATQAGFSVNEIANISATTTSKLGESGTLAGTRLSRLFAIIGGSEGQNAIRQLNQGLNADQQVDTTANVATQVKQLSALYGTLSDKQREALGSKLGGTANTRELFTILAEGNKILETGGNEFDYYGANADEVKKRLNNLRGELQQIAGNLRNIIVAVTNSGVLDPLLAGFSALVPVLKGVRSVFDTFNLIPREVRSIAFALLEVYAALKLIQAINNRGGLRNAVAGIGQNAVSTLAPGYVLNRQQLRAQQQAQRGTTTYAGPAPLVPGALSHLTPAQQKAATTANAQARQAFAQREAARSALQRNQQTQRTARNAISTSNNPLVTNRAQLALVAAQQRQVGLLAASSAAERAYQAALAAETAALRGKTAAGGGFLGGNLRGSANLKDIGRNIRDSFSRAGNYLTNGQSMSSLNRNRVGPAPTATGLLGRGIVAGVSGIGRGVTAAFRGIQTGVSAALSGISAGLKGIPNAARATGGALASLGRTLGSGISAGLSAFGRGVRAIPGALRTANTSLGTFASNLRALSKGGVSVTQAFRDLASGGLVQSVTGSFKKFAGSVRRAVGSELGSGLAIGLGIAAITAVYAKVNEQIKAVNDIQNSISGSTAGNNAEDARSQASELQSQAETARQAANGITGTVTNWIAQLAGAEDVNKIAADADALASASNAYADSLDKIAEQAAVSANAVDSVDLSSPDAITNSLQAMSDSGRDAISQLDAFSAAMTTLIKNTRDGAITLSDSQAATIAAGAGYNATSAIIQGAEDNFNLGEKDLGNAFRKVDQSQVSNITTDVFQEFLDSGGDINSREGRNRLEKMLHDKLDSVLKAAGLDDDSIQSVIDQVIIQGGAQQRSLTTFDGTATGLAQMVAARSELVAPAAAQMGINANLSGQAGGGALAEANANLAGQQKALDDAQAEADAELAKIKDPKDRAAKADQYNKALEAQRAKVKAAQIGVNSAVSAQYAAEGALAQSLIPSTDIIGGLNSQFSTLEKQLSVTTDATERAAIQAQENQLAQQKAQAQVQVDNAQRTAAIDPRDAVALAQNAVTSANAVRDQISESGDTTSEAYFNAVKAANEAFLDAIRANITHMDAIGKASLRAGDEVGEAIQDYNTAILNAKANTIEGSAERAAALREVEQTQGYAVRQKTTARTTAQRNAGIDSRDTLRNTDSEIADLTAQLADLPEGADQRRAELQRQIADKRQQRIEQETAIDNASRSASVRSYDTLAKSRVAVTNALATFRNTLPGTEAYYAALTELREAQFDQAQKELQYNQTLAKIALDPGDTLGAARLAAQQAHETANTFAPGTQERADADLAAVQADYALRQEELATRQAQRSASVFSGDYLGQATVDVQNALDALNNATAGTKEFYAAQKAYKDAAYALVEAQVQAASEARKLNIDLSNPVQTAAEELTAAREALAAAQAAGAPSSVTDKLRNDVRNAELQADQAAFAQRLSDAQIADQLGRTSHAAYLQFLQNEHDRLTQMLSGMDQTSNGYRQAVDQLNQIDQLIQDAKKQLNQQFNLQDVTLPTLYEVRRAVGVSADQIRSQVVDYSSTQGTVIINGADMATVVAYINKTLGKGSTSVYTTSPRRV